MNAKELSKLNAFIERHGTKYKPKSFNIKLTATGIGENIKVTCNSCKTKEDLSDYECW